MGLNSPTESEFLFSFFYFLRFLPEFFGISLNSTYKRVSSLRSGTYGKHDSREKVRALRGNVRAYDDTLALAHSRSVTRQKYCSN